MSGPRSGLLGRRTARYGLVVMLVIALVAVVTVLVGGRDESPSGPDDLLSPHLREYASTRPVRIGWTRGTEPVSIWQGDVVAGGYAVEEWNLLAIKLGISIEHVPFDDAAEVVAALRDGTIDIAGGLGNRADLHDFAEPTDALALERITFVGRPEQARRELGDLSDRTVTTLPDSPLVVGLRSAYPRSNYVATDSMADGLRATADGTVDLFLAPLAVAGYIMREQGLELVPVGDTLQLVPVSAWAPTGSDALDLARAARAHLTDQEISLATLRWTGFDLGPTPTRNNAWVNRLLFLVLGLALVFAAFVLVLQRQVRRATAALSTLNAELEDRVAARTEDLDRAVSGLQRSNEALSEFAQTVAHDLRGPLSAISGFAQLLAKRELPEAEQQQILSAMASSSMRLIAMVDALLEDAARAGARPTRTTGPAYQAWLREVVGPEVRATGADLRVEAPGGEIPLDEALLHRATINLVGNALKYALLADRDPVIEVEVREFERDDWALIVDDNGPGIPEDLREAVFALGFRAVDDNRGHGLGLAETQEQVTRAGGMIEVADSPLGGARFVVHLPVLEPVG